MFIVKENEFEVQSDLYQKLKENFQIVKGEVKFSCEKGRGARFDIVVFNKDLKPIFVVEVKKSNHKKKPNEYKQIRRYKKLVDCPVYLVNNKNDIDSFIGKVIKKHTEEK